MPRILILADDLSGAADCGIACVCSGLSAVVSLGQPNTEATSDVIALDADTRGLSAAAAAQRMRELVSMYAQDPTLLLFKKIDSTLRGHIGAELAAVLAARRVVTPRSVAIMAPAFPVNGRTTVAGMHLVHGKPLHETEMWTTERMSGEAYIPHMLEGSGLRCIHIDLQSVRTPQARFQQEISNAAEAGDVILCDASTDDDLRSIAEAAVSLEGRAIWVGSAGLAHQMPQAAGLALDSRSLDSSSLNAIATISQLPETTGPTLFVIGSASRTTRMQMAMLLSDSNILGIVVPPQVLLDGPGQLDWLRFRAALGETVVLGRDVALICGPEPQIDAIDRPRLSHALGEMAAELRGKVGALVASGGETARKVLDQWGVQTLQLHGELEKGVPVSSTVVGGSHPLTVITKAGDFGQENTLLHCYQWLSQRRAIR